MRRSHPAVFFLLMLLALVACGGTSRAETAYLDAIRGSSVAVSIDEDDALNRGRKACDAILNIKPDSRDLTASVLLDRGYTYAELKAATTHLCPESGLNL